MLFWLSVFGCVGSSAFVFVPCLWAICWFPVGLLVFAFVLVFCRSFLVLVRLLLRLLGFWCSAGLLLRLKASWRMFPGCWSLSGWLFLQVFLFSSCLRTGVWQALTLHCSWFPVFDSSPQLCRPVVTRVFHGFVFSCQVLLESTMCKQVHTVSTTSSPEIQVGPASSRVCTDGARMEYC